jgi:hypothetical protein
MPRILLAIALLLSSIACLSTGADAQQPNILMCQAHSALCPVGTEGPGGCYMPSTSKCYQGRTCPISSSICLKGQFGSGGCFDATVAQCNGGAILYFLQPQNPNALN